MNIKIHDWGEHMNSRGRNKEIDIAKGIGILLVVIGHSFPDVSTPEGIHVPLLRTMHDIIYTFHMPLMFFLAGLLSKRILLLDSGRIRYVYDRFIRLMIPYFAVGLFYMPMKLIMSKYASQPYDIRDFGLIFLGENPDGGLWYLYDLFLIQIILMLCCSVKNVRFVVTLSAVISIVIVCSRTSFYRIDDALYYLFFSALGLLMGSEYDKVIRYTSKIMAGVCIGIFIISAICLIKYDISLFRFICGVTGSACVFCLSRQVVNFSVISRVLCFLGKRTMDVYILHGIVMVVIRIILWSLMKINYYICSVAMLIGGIVIPIVLSNVIIRRSKILKLLVLGERY